MLSYNQILDHFELKTKQDQLNKFRTITAHKGPLSKKNPNYTGSLHNVMIEWETEEITEEPLSCIAVDDPVTCAVYAKQHDLLHLVGWRQFRSIGNH